MSAKTRIAFAVIAALLVVAAVVLAQPDDSSEQADDPSAPAAQTTPGAEPGAEKPETEPTATAESAPPPPPPEIVVRGYEARGGIRRIEVEKGETLEFTVVSDADDEFHLHGYDVYEDAKPGKPARFKLKADIEGIFEVESHEAGDLGKEALVARVVVEPS